MPESTPSAADLQIMADKLNWLYHYKDSMPPAESFQVHETSDGRESYNVHPVFFASDKLKCQIDVVTIEEPYHLRGLDSVIGIDLEKTKTSSRDEYGNHQKIDTIIPTDGWTMAEFDQRVEEYVKANKAEDIAGEFRTAKRDFGKKTPHDPQFEGEVLGRAIRTFTKGMNDDERHQFLQALNKELAPKIAHFSKDTLRKREPGGPI